MLKRDEYVQRLQGRLAEVAAGRELEAIAQGKPVPKSVAEIRALVAEKVECSEGSAIVAPGPGYASVTEAIELAASHALHGLPLSHEQHVAACAEVGRLATGQLAIEHGCPVHSGAVHGGEAQELRKGIEAILELAYDDDDHVNHVKDDLQQLLDRVDAGDSLAYMERKKRESPSGDA